MVIGRDARAVLRQDGLPHGWSLVGGGSNDWIFGVLKDRGAAHRRGRRRGHRERRHAPFFGRTSGVLHGTYTIFCRKNGQVKNTHAGGARLSGGRAANASA